MTGVDLLQLTRTTTKTANLVLTADDAVIGATPKDVVWTYRTTTLYRYRSTQRRHAVPVLLVFALINRPDIFDLRPGHSFVEYLLGRVSTSTSWAGASPVRRMASWDWSTTCATSCPQSCAGYGAPRAPTGCR
jgi:poly(3-hydroxyalkanoate) synthetase